LLCLQTRKCPTLLKQLCHETAFKGFFSIFQIYYETIRKISPGEELLLGQRDPIQLDGMAEGEVDVEDQVPILLNFFASSLTLRRNKLECLSNPSSSG
jgi:hypothetical protein